MRTVTKENFGIATAYLVPGFVALIGVSQFSEAAQLWLYGLPENAPTIGGFLYLTLAALVAGLVMSTIRWMFLDSLFHLIGISRPNWDFQKLQSHIDAYRMLEENHYRYYQFYGNTLISTIFSYLSMRWTVLEMPLFYIDITIGILGFSFLLASADTLKKYYDRVNQLLGPGSEISAELNSSSRDIR